MQKRLIALTVEAALGLLVAALVVLALTASLDSAPFVYQGY